MTNKLIEAMRKQSEEWYSDDGESPRAAERSGENYRLLQAQVAWETWKVAWQAALSAAEAAGYRLVPVKVVERVWAHGYQQGHSDGIGCGHPLAGRCRHDAETEFPFFYDEVMAIAAAPEVGR